MENQKPQGPLTLTYGEIALRLTEACIKSDTNFEWSEKGTMASDAVRIRKVPELFKSFLAALTPDEADAPGEKTESEMVRWPVAEIKCAGMGCEYRRFLTMEQPKALPRISDMMFRLDLDDVRCPECNMPGSMKVEFISPKSDSG